MLPTFSLSHVRPSPVQTLPCSAFQTPSCSAFQTPPYSAFQSPPCSAFQTPPYSAVQTPPYSAVPISPYAAVLSPAYAAVQTSPYSAVLTPPYSEPGTLSPLIPHLSEPQHEHSDPLVVISDSEEEVDVVNTEDSTTRSSVDVLYMPVDDVIVPRDDVLLESIDGSGMTECTPSIQDFSPVSVISTDQILSYQQVYEKNAEKQPLESCAICSFSNVNILQHSLGKARKYMIRHMKKEHHVVGMSCKKCKQIHIPEHGVPCVCPTCRVCGEKFAKRSEMNTHARSQHIRMDIDAYRDNIRAQQRTSVLTPNTTDKYHCLLSRDCCFSSNIQITYIRHMAEQHHIVTHRKPLIVQCPLCSYKSSRVGKVSAHIGKQHMGKNKYKNKSKSIIGNIISFEDQGSDSNPKEPQPIESTTEQQHGSMATEPQQSVSEISEPAASEPKLAALVTQPRPSVSEIQLPFRTLYNF